jgi:hypothetical protein
MGIYRSKEKHYANHFWVYREQAVLLWDALKKQ